MENLKYKIDNREVISLCAKSDKSIAELSIKTGMSINWIQKVLSGRIKNPTINSACKLADVLQVRISDILRRI